MTPAGDPRRCPECGIYLVTDPAEVSPRCPSCGYFRRRLPTVGVAMIVLDGDGRILLGKRAHGYGAGQWCIPCGRVEWDEDVRHAAERELLEETGITARAGEVYAVHSNFHDAPRQTVGIWFTAEDVQGTAHCPDGEFSEVAYFDPASPPELAFPTDALVLLRLVEERPVPHHHATP